MNCFQKEIRLTPKSRGFHLITNDILDAVPFLKEIKIGICTVFIKHTSASITINENVDPTVRQDFESHINKMVPENAAYYKHTYEGPDDMPAHIKASLLGSSVQIHITSGKFNLGVWQGIYLGEHRDYASSRTVVVTVVGQ